MLSHIKTINLWMYWGNSQAVNIEGSVLMTSMKLWSQKRFYSGRNWIDVSLVTPQLPGWVIVFVGRISPWWNDEFSSLCWNALARKGLCQATSWTGALGDRTPELAVGSIRSGIWGNSWEWSMHRGNIIGNQHWVVHNGVTITIIAFYIIIFFRHRWMRHQGGPWICDQSCRKALVASAIGSGFQE